MADDAQSATTKPLAAQRLTRFILPSRPSSFGHALQRVLHLPLVGEIRYK
jgi:hypothetical protein